MAGEAVAALRASVEVERPTVDRFASLRYLGQNFELEVEIRDGDRWPDLRERFGVEHERQYGFDLPGEPIEIINLRATARRDEVALPTRSAAEGAAASRRRPPGLDRDRLAASNARCVRRSSLAPGTTLVGPAVIEEADSTTIVHPGDRVVVDAERGAADRRWEPSR